MQKEITDKVYHLLSDLEKSEPLPENEFDETFGHFGFNVPETYKETKREI